MVPLLPERVRPECARSTAAAGTRSSAFQNSCLPIRREGREEKDEGSSNLCLGREICVSLPAQFASHDGNLLLAVFGPRHLGVHYGLSHEIPRTDLGRGDVFFGGVDPVGYSIPGPAGDYDFVLRGDLVEESYELVCQSAQAERVPCRDDGDECF